MQHEEDIRLGIGVGGGEPSTNLKTQTVGEEKPVLGTQPFVKGPGERRVQTGRLAVGRRDRETENMGSIQGGNRSSAMWEVHQVDQTANCSQICQTSPSLHQLVVDHRNSL